MADPECICEFGANCSGSGMISCDGCGGDQCVCLCCFGNGEVPCPGCEYCEHREEPDHDLALEYDDG